MSMTLHELNSKPDGMIRIRDARVYDLQESIKASKFPMAVNPDRYDEAMTNTAISLAQCKPCTGHDNWLQGVRVAFTMDITAKALVEAERYHFFDIISSTSTMHRITGFNMNECYCEYVDSRMISVMNELVTEYNETAEKRRKALGDGTLDYAEDLGRSMEAQYLRILYSNPCGFTYTIRFTTNYRQLKTIYLQRKDHRLPEWREFCEWIEMLPHAYLITGKEAKVL